MRAAVGTSTLITACNSFSGLAGPSVIHRSMESGVIDNGSCDRRCGRRLSTGR